MLGLLAGWWRVVVLLLSARRRRLEVLLLLLLASGWSCRKLSDVDPGIRVFAYVRG